MFCLTVKSSHVFLPNSTDLTSDQCQVIAFTAIIHSNKNIASTFDFQDISPYVRVQAIKALCRLQIKDDPTDEVTQIFLFHLEYDPCPLVRQTVISTIARSVHTIPFIIERLWDVAVTVRRSVLAHMSNFSLSKCTVDQRLTLLEQGLTDCSEAVRNV